MGKDKQVGTLSSSPNNFNNGNAADEDENFSDTSENPSFPSVNISSRNASSKYDFVKVKVWLGDHADHYYVLSRFLLSRMLTVTKIPNHVAVKIALELKKLLIDNSLLDVSQSDLEANLFKLMERRGYGEEYINRYKMMTRFHHQRVPLVILVCGTACVGKSTIATQLAQRLNLPNVLQTEMVYELLRTSTDAPLASTPVWARDFSSAEELITEFCRECRIVRKGLAGDLKKAMKDGKPIIIEGIHLDPSIYLMDEGNKSPANTAKKPKEASSSSMTDHDSAIQTDRTSVVGDHSSNSSICTPGNVTVEGTPGNVTVEERNSCDEVNPPDCQESVEIAGTASYKDAKNDSNAFVLREKSGPEPIIIPIVLKMAEFDHKALLEEWVSTRTYSDKCSVQDKDRIIANLKTIQGYLCSFKSQGMAVVNISATTFPQTLDWLHAYLLQSIEQGISSAASESSRQLAEKKIA